MMSNQQYRQHGRNYDDGYPRDQHPRVQQHQMDSSGNGPPEPYYPPHQQSAVRYRQPDNDSRYQPHDLGTATNGGSPKDKVAHPVPILRLVLDAVLLALSFVPVILLNTVAKPFERGFYCDDESIRYPYKNDTITPLTLYTVGAAVVLVTVLILETVIALTTQSRNISYSIKGKKMHPLLSSVYIYIGYCAVGFVMVQIATDICKNMVGRLRPHFIDACDPDWQRINCSGYRYVPQAFCRSTEEKILKDARYSFLSGHASYSGYMMFYLVLYLQARWRWPGCSLLAKHFLQFAFAMLCLFTCLSRISDYKHHWSDVLAGLTLGIFGACLTTLHIGKFFKRKVHAILENETSEQAIGFVPGHRYFGGISPAYGKAV